MGWLDAIGGMFEWASGSGVFQSLVRVAAAFGLMRWVSGSQQPPSSGTTSVVSNRIQVPPATDNKIPVAYGKSYFNGTIIDVQLTNNNKSMYAAIVLCETTGNLLSTGSASSITIDNIYLDNKKITFKSDGTTVDYVTDDTGVVDTNPSGLMGIYLYKGGSAYPMLPCQPGTTTPITGTVPNAAYTIMPGWDNTYNANNTIFAIVKLNYDQSKGQHNIPNLKFHVCNTMTLPGDCLYDYMTNGLYGANIPSGLINTSSVSALNTYSAQSVTYSPYSAQQRYTINGLISTSQKVLTNMDLIAASAASYITYDISSGQWAVLIQKVTAQSFTFNDSNILGQVNATGTALDTFYNSVEVQFPYAYLRDQSNYVRADLSTAALDYNEPINVLKVQYGLINNVVQATIIANILLRQSREDLVVVFKTDFSSYNLQVGDVFGLTNGTYGFTNKPFRVIKLVKTESETGELTIEVTGLAYDDNVYTVSNISSFIPTIGPGYSIPNLGAIATPIAPTLTSSTISSQPSITVTATIPTGVVTDMEFWASSDGTVYKFQGSTRNPNSGPFTSGTTTQFKTIELQTATWYFKVRAANSQGTSAFSPASAGLAYTYIQAPDVLPYSAPVVDSAGNSLTSGTGAKLALGALAFYVAGKINWGDIASKTADELASLFGISPDTVTQVKSAVNSVFNGSVSGGTGISVSNAGVVSINASIDALNDVDTSTTAPTTNQCLIWNGVNWVPGDCGTGTGGGGTGGGATPCFLTPVNYYPTVRSTYPDPLYDYKTDADNAPISGNYSIRFSADYAALSKGSGTASLYKSDGTLAGTVAASAAIIDKNIVSLPFSTRDLGVDYYILMPAGFVTNNGCLSPAILSPTTWKFHTGTASAYSVAGDPIKVALSTCSSSAVTLSKYITETLPNVAETTPHSKVYIQSNIGLVYNEAVVLQTTGTITIQTTGGSLFQTIDLSKNFSNAHTSELAWVSGNTLWINVTKDFDPGINYCLKMTSNCVKDVCGINGNTQIANTTTVAWITDNNGSTPSTNTGGGGTTVVASYDRAVTRGTGSANIVSNGSTVGTIPALSPNISLSTQDA